MATPAGDACGDTGCGCATDHEAVDRPAIACRLDIGQMGSRVEEWSVLDTKEDMLSGVMARTAIDDGVRVHVAPGTDVAGVARLAAAEQDCCGIVRITSPAA